MTLLMQDRKYPSSWASTAALIMNSVSRMCQKKKSCSVMLTGGRSAERLYRAWRDMNEFSQLRNVGFYFGDERNVPPDHQESNYGLAMRTLFERGVPEGCSVFRMKSEHHDLAAAAAAYDMLLPERIDVLILSVGEDGHIASLFSHSPALSETFKRVVPIRASKPPFHRLTVTPRVIANAKRVFVMAIGSSKHLVFNEAMADPCSIAELPARMVLNATWIFDSCLSD